MTGQVVRTEDHCFACGGMVASTANNVRYTLNRASIYTIGYSEIYKGEWSDPLTGEVVQVSVLTILLTGCSSRNAQVAIKLLRGIRTDPVMLEETKRVSPSKQGNNYVMNWYGPAFKSRGEGLALSSPQECAAFPRRM